MTPSTCPRCGRLDVSWSAGHSPTCDAPPPRALRAAHRMALRVLLRTVRVLLALAARLTARGAA